MQQETTRVIILVRINKENLQRTSLSIRCARASNGIVYRSNQANSLVRREIGSLLAMNEGERAGAKIGQIFPPAHRFYRTFDRCATKFSQYPSVGHRSEVAQYWRLGVNQYRVGGPGNAGAHSWG